MEILGGGGRGYEITTSLTGAARDGTEYKAENIQASLDGRRVGGTER